MGASQVVHVQRGRWRDPSAVPYGTLVPHRAMQGLLIKTWIPLLASAVNIWGESFISLCLGVFVGNAGLQ